MKFFDQLKLGRLALQIATAAAALAHRIGTKAVRKILAEVVRLEDAEPDLPGREKFDRLVDFIRKEVAVAVQSIDPVHVLVSLLIELFKLTGLFQSRSADPGQLQ